MENYRQRKGLGEELEFETRQPKPKKNSKTKVDLHSSASFLPTHVSGRRFYPNIRLTRFPSPNSKIL